MTDITNIVKYELLIIYKLQNYFDYNQLKHIIKTTKIFTNKRSIFFFVFIALLYDYMVCIKLIIGIGISRTSNFYIKNSIRSLRPYNKYPRIIKYYKKKKKLSYSFPSQSIQNVTVVYYIFNQQYYLITLFYWYIMIAISLTRMFRGLHYPHDIIFSYLYSYFIALFLNYLF
jgi:hypothetical protein